MPTLLLYNIFQYLLCFSSSLTDRFDSYIMVSFVNATLVLSIGETVEEVTDSGFLGTTPTLACSQLGDDALVQVRMRADGMLWGEVKACDIAGA